MPYDDTFAQDRDKVRFYLGDTDNTDLLLSDSEVEFLITQESNLILAAALGADMLAAKFARQINTSTIGVSISAADRQKHFETLADRLRTLANRSTSSDIVEPYAGGVYKSKDELLDDNDDIKRFDLVPSRFKAVWPV